MLKNWQDFWDIGDRELDIPCTIDDVESDENPQGDPVVRYLRTLQAEIGERFTGLELFEHDFFHSTDLEDPGAARAGIVLLFMHTQPSVPRRRILALMDAIGLDADDLESESPD